MKNKAFSGLALFILFIFSSINFHFKAKEEIKWVTIEKAYELNKKEPRMTVIDLYTEWCGWCKKMDKTTYSSPEVINYLNTKCYAVKFDAESKQPVTIGNKTFNYSPQNRMHEAAVALLQGQASFPTTVFLKGDFSIIQAVPGYLDENDFQVVANYLGGEHYKKTPFEVYKKNYKK